MTTSVEDTDVLEEEDEDEEALVAVALEPLMPVVPNGEHPTKFGAVELTAAHSCILNCIAATQLQRIYSHPSCFYSLCCSALLQVVARQHDSALTYAGLLHRHLTSICGHSDANCVELLRHAR